MLQGLACQLCRRWQSGCTCCWPYTHLCPPRERSTFNRRVVDQGRLIYWVRSGTWAASGIQPLALPMPRGHTTRTPSPAGVWSEHLKVAERLALRAGWDRLAAAQSTVLLESWVKPACTRRNGRGAPRQAWPSITLRYLKGSIQYLKQCCQKSGPPSLKHSEKVCLMLADYRRGVSTNKWVRSWRK